LVVFYGTISGIFFVHLWVELDVYAGIFSVIGGIGQWIGVLIILMAFYKIRVPLKNNLTKLTMFSLQFTFSLLMLKSTMELGLMVPSLADLVYDTRSVIIGYLHLTLLGFISMFILTQYQMVHILNISRMHTIGLSIFIAGFLLNELLLFLQGLIEWVFHSEIPYYSEGLLIASIALTFGVIMISLSVRIRASSHTIE